MRIQRLVSIAAVITALSVSSSALAQALPNLNLLRVRYNTAKTSAKPQGDLKAQIDQIDKDLAEAARMGRAGEQRRLFARGFALLAGRPWTDADDFQASLVLRTSAVVVDSSERHVVRLEQIFAPSIALSQPLTAVATISRAAAGHSAGNASGRLGAPVESRTIRQVSRDLRESPLAMDLDLSKVPDGMHMLSVEVKHGEQSIGTASLRVALRKGLDQQLRRLEADAAAAAPEVRADIRYPADYVRKINQRHRRARTIRHRRRARSRRYDRRRGQRRQNPFAGRTGGFERHYVLEGANEIMPYRVYCRPATTAAARFR